MNPVLGNLQSDVSQHLRVKPVYKPDVHLKKSRQRVFNECSIDLLYSFGLQNAYNFNLCLLKENIVILIAGNFLNFLNIDTMTETFLPSVHGAGFCCVAVHASAFFFAAAEKGPKFCINIFSYPGLDVCKTLVHETCIMPTCLMQFHPHGDLLIALTCDPENKILIWLWELELMCYASDDSAHPVYSMHFSSHDHDTFITSGEGHITFWHVSCTRDDRDAITEVEVTQQEEVLVGKIKFNVCCTVSIADSFLSGTSFGFLIMWHIESLTFEDSIIIGMHEDSPCHEGPINHIIMQRNIIITFGSDGNIKFWDYNDIIKAFQLDGEEEEVLSDEETNINVNASKSKIFPDSKNEYIEITPQQTVLVSKTSDLVYGIILKVTLDSATYLIQDKNGSLFQADVSSDFSVVKVTSLLCGVGCNLVDIAVCPVYPLVLTASTLGTIVVYDFVSKEVFKSDTLSTTITSILWPSIKVEMFATSFLVGFEDGTLRWLSFANDNKKFSLKYVVKSHTEAIHILKMNDSYTILISQGLDNKLFFYSVENFTLVPLGFYIIHHDVIDFIWLKYYATPDTEEHRETLLILCKYSYLIETEVPGPKEFKNTFGLRNTFLIESKKYQIYKINGLREYHQLGDRVYDSDCEEETDLNEAGKEVLKKLKYKEKKESRENRRQELGFNGPITPPEILSYLPAAEHNHIWLSLGKEDFGYIFEFEFKGNLTNEVVELIPINALEILTAEIIPVLTMQYSPCGKFIFMGLEDGSFNICYLEHAFRPESGYDFVKYQIHDSDVGAISHIRISPEGSLIASAGCDGNLFLFHFNMFEYKTFENYGIKPIITCSEEMEDIASEKLSVEECLKNKVNEKYRIMKEQRQSTLESIKEKYLELKEMALEYSDLCQSSLKKMKSVPDELKLDFTNYCVPPLAIEVFTRATNKLIKDIDLQFQKDIMKSTLLYEKYFQFFKSKVEHEKLLLEHSNKGSKNILSTFRGCKMPIHFDHIQETNSYPKMLHKTKDGEKVVDYGKSQKHKISDEKMKLEYKLSVTSKAIIDYPSDTPVYELISKYNERKKEQIKILKEHISEYQILEKLSPDEGKYAETLQQIEASHFKFKESHSSEQSISEYMYTYDEKKVKTALYFQKASKFWKYFNSLALVAFDKNPIITSLDIQPEYKEEISESPLKIIEMHIYFKIGKSLKDKKQFKIKWPELPEGEKDCISRIKENAVLSIQEEKLNSDQKILNNFIFVLTTAKPKLNCEKKFHDVRFNLRCIEMNIFKSDLGKEKKLLKAMKELEGLLNEENIELQALTEKINMLKTKREQEKKEWMNVYSQFCKVIGMKHKHKGYFKQIFKKKIRPDEEKEPYTRHPSSESSDSEEDISSDDDCHNVNPQEVDQDLLREVMLYRLRRHEVELRMKEYKRALHNASAKELTLQRKIQRIKDALNEAGNELSFIPMNRKLAWENINWPVVLYPENVHLEFICKSSASADEQKRYIHAEMARLYETVLKELKGVNKYVTLLMVILMDKVVNAEINDLIDIACVFLFIVDYVSDEVDEYFKKLSHSDSYEDFSEEKQAEEKPINYIQEILFSADKTAINLSIKSDSKPETSDIETDLKPECTQKTKFNNKLENIETGIFTEMEFEDLLHYDKAKDTDMTFDNQSCDVVSWRDVRDDDYQTELSNESEATDIDVNEIIANVIPSLDISLFETESFSKSEDYYMQPFHVAVNHKEIKDISGFNFNDYAQMLLEMDIAEVIDDLIKSVEEAEQCVVKNVLDSFFPTHPGGGLVLKKEVLISMEKEDPDFFPYSDFFQEIVLHEEITHKPKRVHIIPKREEVIVWPDLTPLPVSDFIVLNSHKILNVLKAYHNIKLTTLECEEQIRYLEKKVLRAKNKRINIEQKLIAVERTRTQEMNSKFSGPVNLDLLQDVIENPHLRIKKYEIEKKIDLLQQNLRKLKASEVIALKSLDKLGFEDTEICHELLQLRREFKRLNKNYSSKQEILPRIGDNFCP